MTLVVAILAAQKRFGCILWETYVLLPQRARARLEKKIGKMDGANYLELSAGSF